MKNLILIAVVGIFLMACTASEEKKHSENIDLVKSYVKAVESLDFEAMENYLDENYLGIGPSYGDSIWKNEAVENWKWSAENLYEKIQYTQSRFVAQTITDGENKGEWVGTWALLNIVFKDDIGSVNILSNTNYLIENGKIKRSITFYNEADVLRQLGYKFVPAEYEE